MTCNQVKVPRAPIMVCLQCPLCCNLVHEATTISECLHTFCRSCIYQQLGDGENDSCPICNVSLGCSPLEKLRADHQLDDVCAKLFPVKGKRKNEIDNNTDCDAPPPVRRKERTLSSLGIGAASTSHPGIASRRTRPVSRRSTAARETSTDDELEERKGDKVSRKRLADRDSQDESGSDERAAASESCESHEVEKDKISDDEHVDETTVLQVLRRERSVTGRKGVTSQWSQERSKASSLCNVDSTKLEMFLADRSKISATGLLQSQISEATNSSDKMLTRKHGNNDNHFKVPPVSTKTERPYKILTDQSPLAHLAEVAVDQAGKFEYLDGPKARGPRARRGRGKSESGKSSAMGGSLSWQAMLENIRSAAAPQEKKQKPKNPSPAKILPPPKKPPTVRAAQASSNKRSQSPSSVIKHEKQNVGFWFCLEAADNQFDENALPQIATRYLRIKDGKLPVSSVKKYLVKKLDLLSEAEVEITCRGQPVVPNLPLEKVQGIWLATTPSTLELLPTLKDVNFASQDSKTWAQYKGRSGEDCTMVLTYSRHRRQLLAQ
ncbi:hypothetical protein GOP47_0030420 [Adiantum capillus-veneris]|nr:hypothetical protein GOP47_0030420 [Adiantum capillus-veneris]